jgi:HEAT repeat protein
MPAAPQRPLMLPPHAQAPAVPPGAGLEYVPTPQMVALLRTSLYPSQREYAADCLSRQDCRNQPQVVQALVSAAKDDLAPAVRAGCVRALARLHVNTPTVVAALKAMQADPDGRVRQEVELALGAVGVAVQPHGESGLRPASASTADR